MSDIATAILIDDNPVSGEAYADLLVRAMGLEEIRRYSTPSDMQIELDSASRCLVVIHFDLVSLEKFSAIADLCRSHPNVLPVIVSGPPDHETATDAMACGAVAYLPRTFTPNAVMAVLKLVIEGERFLPAMPPVPRHGEAPAVFEGPSASKTVTPEQSDDLTDRQKEILTMIAQGAPNKTIARSLGISHVTVKSHLSRIYRTLGVSSRTQAARQCYLKGDVGDARDAVYFGHSPVARPSSRLIRSAGSVMPVGR